MKQTIQDWTGKIIGYVETKSNGDKVVTDFYGKILGFYKKMYDITTDFYGRQIAKGDVAVSLLHM